MEALASTALCTVDDVKAYRGRAPERADQGDLLTRLVNAASASFARASRREWVGPAGSAARTFSTYGNRAVWIGDASTVTAVEVLTFDGTATALASTDWQVHPLYRAAWEPITAVRVAAGVDLDAESALRVTATWGWPDVPEDVRQAVVEQVSLWLLRDVERMAAGFQTDDAARTGTLRALSPSVYDVAREYRPRRIW